MSLPSRQAPVRRRLIWFLVATAAFGIAGASPSTLAATRVVINEVMYHPPDDRDDLQWIELFNAGAEPAPLQGWALKKGAKFSFQQPLTLPPGGFLVLARDRAAFAAHYGTGLPLAGDFSGRLAHGGETLELTDATGQTVDRVTYDDQPPWPRSPDGLSCSLERCVPTGPGDLSENWAPSPLPDLVTAAGTPGRPNASYAANPPPVIRASPIPVPQPGTPITVTASIADADGLQSAVLEYQSLPIDPPRPNGDPSDPEWLRVAMNRQSGDDQRGDYAAEIPGQPAGRLLRLRIQATDARGTTRIAPHPHDARPTWTAYVGPNLNLGQIPFAFLIEFGPRERPGASLRHRADPNRGEPARGSAACILMPPKGGPIEVRDHIRITPRNGGWKVRLHKDAPLEEMSTVNVIFESQPRWVLAEHLAYELYQAAGVPSPLSGHWRVWHNGRPLGYHLYVEQPNASFLRRTGHDPDGDLFKLLWYGNGLIGQHEKKNNPETGHSELAAVVQRLRSTGGAQRSAYIQEAFDVEECASYYAVNMCLQNWDGFFNNYFIYRAPGKTGKWRIFPWDEDKTWGDYDGSSPQYDWYEMPLTMGMEGDRPSASLRSFFSGGPFGGTQWWRPPGWFSGPLLADPQFRSQFRQRLRDLCDTVFTPDSLAVAIRRLEIRLEPEVTYRALVVGSGRSPDPALLYSDPTQAMAAGSDRVASELARFRRHIDSFRRQVQFRREFLLKELARER